MSCLDTDYYNEESQGVSRMGYNAPGSNQERMGKCVLERGYRRGHGRDVREMAAVDREQRQNARTEHKEHSFDDPKCDG
ncbi:hypothetical protein TNIN_164131 [Trichonephila inaurata madagascariensis]|uniref:Uncharacterized protein n=1 Tax=Trichonephila inaurata madagascariensis TaxID=2747483 RepID=A0A8X6XFD5_9ARAC|nr:hypothetical protein TNIN_164131 [Trichonephila inaurata madagascariensis]